MEGGPGAEGMGQGNTSSGVPPPDELEESVSLREFTEWYRTAHADDVSAIYFSAHAKLTPFLQLKAKDETTGEQVNAETIIEQKYEEYRKDFLVRQVSLSY